LPCDELSVYTAKHHGHAVLFAVAELLVGKCTSILYWPFVFSFVHFMFSSFVLVNV